jgi:uroporphyrinogen decarboxylase
VSPFICGTVRKSWFFRIVELVKAAVPGTPVIGFPRGSGPLAERYAKETGVDALGCDTSMPIGWIKSNLQSHRPVQGNLDPAALLAPWRELRFRIDEVLDRAAGRPGHVFNVGHGLTPRTPADNVRRLVERVRERTSE